MGTARMAAVHPALTDAAPIALVLDATAPSAPAAARRSTGDAARRPVHRRRRVHRAVGGAARQGATTRRATSSCSRPRRSASARAGATAASSSPRSPTASPTALAPLRRRDADARAPRARRTSRASRPTSRATAIDCDFERTGELRRDPRAPPGGVDRGGGRAAAPLRPRRRGPRRRGHAGRGRLADATAAASGTAPAPALLDPAGSPRACGAAAARPACAIHERTRGRRRSSRAARRRRCARPAAASARAACCWPRARSRRSLRAIRRYVVPVYDYVLVTEPLSAGAARRRSAGDGARASATAANQFHYYRLHRRRPDPVRRLRRRLPLRRPGRPGARRPRRDLRPARRSTSSRPSRSSRACASPTAGAARSTPRAASAVVLRHRARRPGRLRRRLHRPRASARPASAARVALDLLDGRDTEADPAALRAPPAGPVPARAAALRPSSQLTRNRLAAADRARGPPRRCGCARSTALGARLRQLALRPPRRRSPGRAADGGRRTRPGRRAAAASS